MAAGPGERQQESHHSGPAHCVQVVRFRQGGLRVGLLQQLGHQDPAEQKVRLLSESRLLVVRAFVRVVVVTRRRVRTQPEQLCGHRGPAGGRAPVQVLRGRPVDAGSHWGQ